MKKIYSIILFLIITIATLSTSVLAAVNPLDGGTITSMPTFPDVGTTTTYIDSEPSRVAGGLYVPISGSWRTNVNGTTLSGVSYHPYAPIPMATSRSWPSEYQNEDVEYSQQSGVKQSIVVSGLSSGSTGTHDYYITKEFENDDTKTYSLVYTASNTANIGAIYAGQFVGCKRDNLISYGLKVGVANNPNFTYYIKGTYYWYNSDNNNSGKFDVDTSGSVLAGNYASFLPEQYSLTLTDDTYTDFMFDGVIYWVWNISSYPKIFVDYAKSQGISAVAAQNVLVDYTNNFGGIPSVLQQNPVASFAYTYGTLNYVSGGDTLNIEITANGSYEYDVSDYSKVAIDVNLPNIITPPSSPSEVLTITENGFYDVSQFNYVDADIPPDVVEVPAEFPSLFGWVGNVLNGVLDFELMPNFSLGGILIIIVGLALIVWLLKVFLGG